MYLYTFNADVFIQRIVDVLPRMWIKPVDGEAAPFEDFGDCLLCEDDLPVDEAHSIWESRCYK